jgi:hypothetical protein
MYTKLEVPVRHTTFGSSGAWGSVPLRASRTVHLAMQRGVLCRATRAQGVAENPESPAPHSSWIALLTTTRKSLLVFSRRRYKVTTHHAGLRIAEHVSGAGPHADEPIGRRRTVLVRAGKSGGRLIGQRTYRMRPLRIARMSACSLLLNPAWELG